MYEGQIISLPGFERSGVSRFGLFYRKEKLSHISGQLILQKLAQIVVCQIPAPFLGLNPSH